MKQQTAFVVSVFLLSGAVAAQTETSSATPVPVDWASAGKADAAMALPAQPMSVSFGDYSAQIVGVQYDYAGAVVTGAPYSADAVTESVQMLYDGNRIRQRNEARLYRDTEGRTRREQRLNTLGAWQLSGDVARLVFVHDPVGKKSFMLDVRNRVARQLATPQAGRLWKAETGDSVAFGSNVTLPAAGAGTAFVGAPTTVSFMMDTVSTVTEELGERNFDGVTASGSRMRMSIAAGAIGNEQAIEVSTESWYSPALKAVVLRKRSDPRFGEITYRLVNISLGEPDAALFRVPEDYQVVE